MADIQYFGDVQLDDGSNARTLLFIDEDAGGKGLLAWYPNNSPNPKAAEINIERSSQNWRITIRDIYEQRDGRVSIAILSQPDRDRANRSWATLSPMPPQMYPTNGALSGHWVDPNENKQRPIKLFPSSRESSITAYQCDSWEEFKRWAQRVHDAGAEVFRGHADSMWLLETSLYRAGRTNLKRYISETLNEFHGHLEAAGVVVDRDKPSDFGRMLAIAQHHGLPTPLLDWSRSPYIAAWFAFSDALNMPFSDPMNLDPAKKQPCVRIYALTSAFVQAFGSVTVPSLNSLWPYAVFADFSARDNPRLYAQQGRFLVTNLGNLEGFLVQSGRERSKDYIWAADVPRTETIKALKDLSLMGLSAATMFPGVEGACRMLSQRMQMQKRAAVPMPPPPSQ